MVSASLVVALQAMRMRSWVLGLGFPAGFGLESSLFWLLLQVSAMDLKTLQKENICTPLRLRAEFSPARISRFFQKCNAKKAYLQDADFPET